MQPFSAIEKELTKLLNRLWAATQEAAPTGPISKAGAGTVGDIRCGQPDWLERSPGERTAGEGKRRVSETGGGSLEERQRARSPGGGIPACYEFAESYHDDILDAVGLHRPAGQQGHSARIAGRRRETRPSESR